MLCQVELPKKDKPQWQNIDIGFTSNGKKNYNETLIECSKRETFEEAQIRLSDNVYDHGLQTCMRNLCGVPKLPLYFTFKGVFCYILIIP
jgi:hypothetical protein